MHSGRRTLHSPLSAPPVSSSTLSYPTRATESTSAKPLRFLWIGFDGAGSNPPALALTSELLQEGHAILLAGVEREGHTSTALHLRLLTDTQALLERDGPTIPSFFQHCIANRQHVQGVQALVDDFKPDRLIVDCLMFGALAALELAAKKGKDGKAALPPAFLYVHSTVAALVQGPLILQMVNGLRGALDLDAATDLYEV